MKELTSNETELVSAGLFSSYFVYSGMVELTLGITVAVSIAGAAISTILRAVERNRNNNA
ncbi:hypothetical protein MACH09_03360 [Vibrio sp. MACH09]|uniref:hypothetical protein n=1 Tax=unclassified Vibrio TaxID=2614977 RepID=UPI001493681A|nr:MULTISPECIES: hypothetical protein [unclassified Vibrio]NOI65843.1 hypothetical protein [Vibrio sp. 99-8-1]GLO59828.1 hypothetical protein MACH09_03360 [Vibrio sp. MACH09]